MARFNPSQVSFAGGEISPQLLGRVDSDLYKKALALCRNFRPTPYGSALMRSGSVMAAVWPEAHEPRLFAFRRLGVADDVVVAMSDGKARVYDRTSGVLSFIDNLITNGHFDGGSDGWTLANGALWVTGLVVLPRVLATPAPSMGQSIPTTAGVHYTLTFRARKRAITINDNLNIYIAGVYQGHFTPIKEATWETITFTWTGAAGPTDITLKLESTSTMGGTGVDVDDVLVTSDAEVPHSDLTVPWSNAQLDDVQYAPDRSKNRALFAHPEVNPFVFGNTWSAVWEAYAAGFGGMPGTWGGSNWPGVVEFGFQGRTWWAATPSDPNRLWGSRSGSPFDLTMPTGPPVASDPLDELISTKGTIEWLMGHHVLLAGSEAGEHGITGSQKVISTGDINVSDESAFGAASVQAAHIGDQVVFVTPDRRHVRALTYSLQENGWLTKAITFVADHLTTGFIREVHWAKSPVPTLILLMQDGTIAACTYDRSEQVLAWWQLPLAGNVPVRSCAVANTTDGAELWVSLTRNGQIVLERIPLHEVGVGYLDSSVTGVVTSGGTFEGLAHLVGVDVSIVVDGARRPSQVVQASQDETLTWHYRVTLDPADAGLACTVGLPFASKFKQLPLEGGLQAGSSQSAKRRVVRARLRLNNSAIPLVNGKRPPERAPADPMDTGTDLITGDVDYHELGYEDDGALTVEQDLPFRTEVLGIFGTAQVNEV